MEWVGIAKKHEKVGVGRNYKNKKKMEQGGIAKKTKKMKWREIISQTRQKNEKLEIIVSVN